MAQRGKGIIPSAVFFIGLIGLFQIMRQPRFAEFRTVDVIQLVASGACFGVGLMAVIIKLREPRA